MCALISPVLFERGPSLRGARRSGCAPGGRAHLLPINDGLGPPACGPCFHTDSPHALAQAFTVGSALTVKILWPLSATCSTDHVGPPSILRPGTPAQLRVAAPHEPFAAPTPSTISGRIPGRRGCPASHQPDAVLLHTTGILSPPLPTDQQARCEPTTAGAPGSTTDTSVTHRKKELRDAPAHRCEPPRGQGHSTASAGDRNGLTAGTDTDNKANGVQRLEPPTDHGSASRVRATRGASLGSPGIGSSRVVPCVLPGFFPNPGPLATGRAADF